MALKDPTMRRTPVLSALAVASTLALAACGEAPESGNTDTTTSATNTATTEADGEISADHDDTDIVFARMMIPHHQQAVEIGRITTILLLHFAVLPGAVGRKRKSVHKFAKRVLWHLPATYRRNQAPG
ncbi:DUF305 domain-containing protein [Corynebacterium sp. UMB10119B.1]|uniref:DUF305 domain-containing protein n=1 Tax=Corynebacterium sp. UMB10119B.1 TaxID=3050601 RepID=UPI00255175D2|nr:DUF305 domain-containing protein [Corynebacterium sp. UMB10119B]MDK8364096.1 DUF305 domain-containing protein [Corynebacterium sp. UMB10119B]